MSDSSLPTRRRGVGSLAAASCLAVAGSLLATVHVGAWVRGSADVPSVATVELADAVEYGIAEPAPAPAWGRGDVARAQSAVAAALEAWAATLSSVQAPDSGSAPEPSGASWHPPHGEASPCSVARDDAPPGTEAWLEIESLGLRQPIVRGGQGTIDSGVVTHYEAPDWLPPVEPGQLGAYWLAAHNHCGLFATLPQISDGAGIVITDTAGAELARYTAVARVSVDGRRQLAWSSFYRWGNSRAYAVLQTCTPGSQRLLVYAVAGGA